LILNHHVIKAAELSEAKTLENLMLFLQVFEERDEKQ